MTKVIVYVEGGMVVDVYSKSKNVEAVVFDVDNMKDGEGISSKKIDALWKVYSTGMESVLYGD